MWVSEPEVERWNGQRNSEKLRGNPGSVTYASGRGLRRRFEASLRCEVIAGSRSGLLKPKAGGGLVVEIRAGLGGEHHQASFTRGPVDGRCQNCLDRFSRKFWGYFHSILNGAGRLRAYATQVGQIK